MSTPILGKSLLASMAASILTAGQTNSIGGPIGSTQWWLTTRDPSTISVADPILNTEIVATGGMSVPGITSYGLVGDNLRKTMVVSVTVSMTTSLIAGSWPKTARSLCYMGGSTGNSCRIAWPFGPIVYNAAGVVVSRTVSLTIKQNEP